MSTKATGLPCYDKAGENEELFVLRGVDLSSPEVVVEWIKQNIRYYICPDDKLREALECALRMRQQGKKRAD